MSYAVKSLSGEQILDPLSPPFTLFLNADGHPVAMSQGCRTALTLGTPADWSSLWPAFYKRLQPCLEALTTHSATTQAVCYQIQRDAQQDCFAGTVQKLDAEETGFLVCLTAVSSALHGQHGQLLSSLAPGIVHALRNPLNSMGIHLFLMEEQFSHPLSPQFAELPRYTAVLREECERLSHLLDSLITCVLPTLHPPQTVELNPFLEQLLVFISPLARHGGVHFHYQLADEPLWVKNPGGYLNQILLLLVLSLLKELRQGDSLMLRLEPSPEPIKGTAVIHIETHTKLAQTASLPPGVGALLTARGGELRVQQSTAKALKLEIRLALSSPTL